MAIRLFSFLFSIFFLIFGDLPAQALPPEDDLPEEILATEIILEQRSYLNNNSLTINQYTLQKEDEINGLFPANIDAELKHKVFLLQILKMLRTVTPIK